MWTAYEFLDIFGANFLNSLFYIMSVFREDIKIYTYLLTDMFITYICCYIFVLHI